MLRMKVLTQLNGRQREEVRALESLCREQDNIEGGISLTADEDAGTAPKYFLCYDEELLAGFAIMYRMPDMTAEVCSYIHPQYRKRTMYKKLGTAVCREFKQEGISIGYYVFEPHVSRDFDEIAGRGYFTYSYSEYLMEWKYSYQLLPTNTLTLQPVSEQNREAAAQLLAGAFSMPEQEAAARIPELESGGCVYYAVWQHGEMVGVFALSEEKESFYVFDFAVDADHQGRGIGKAQLKEVIRLAQEKCAGAEQKKVRIQVGSRNEAAFRLYQKNGFQVISQRDYYLVNLDEGEGNNFSKTSAE